MSNGNLIHCERHGQQCWYIICRHIVDDGSDAEHFVECSRERPGECLCVGCCDQKPGSAEVYVICERCLCVLAQHRLNMRRLRVQRSWRTARFQYGVPN